MVTREAQSHDKLSRLDDSESCMEWTVSKDPRSPQRQNRSRTPQQRRAHKRLLHQVLNVTGPAMRAVLVNDIFKHSFYKRGLFQRGLALTGLTRSKRARAIHGLKNALCGARVYSKVLRYFVPHELFPQYVCVFLVVGYNLLLKAIENNKSI